MRKTVTLGVLGLTSIIGMFFLPVSQHRIISPGVDDFESHRPVFGKRSYSQDFVAAGPITSVGAILVDLYRSGTAVPAHIILKDPLKDILLVELDVPRERIQDDSFAQVSLPVPIAARGQRIRITITAPQATKEKPLGIRIDPTHSAANTQRFEDKSPKPGALAIQVTERVPFRVYAATIVRQNPRLILTASAALFSAVLISALSFIPLYKRYRDMRKVQILIVGLVILLALLSRLAIISRLYGASGGDPYNYLFITDRLINLENPFAGEKRLPGYPILLIPSLLYPSINPIAYMRVVSAASAAGTLVMIALLARTLRLSWPVALLSVTLLAWQKDFFWTSLRPEAYTLYAFLLVTCLVLYFSADSRRLQILFGIVLGFAAMTRQEGLVLGVILLLSLLIGESYGIWTTRKSVGSSPVGPTIRKLLFMFAPALLIVSPFFISNTIQHGNPFFSPYFQGERLQIVDSWNAFLDALGATWGIMGSLWKPSWDQLERYELGRPIFVTAMFGALVWYGMMTFLSKRKQRALLPFIGIVGFIVLSLVLWVSVSRPPLLAHNVPAAISALILACVIPFLLETSWRGAIVMLIAVSQLLIATWFHPFAKHYQQSLPLIVLGLSTILFSPLSRRIGVHGISRLSQIAAGSALLLPFFLISGILIQSLPPFIDDSNAEAALDSVAFRAARFAKFQAKPVGFNEAYLPARLYFGDQAHYFPPEEHATEEQENMWLTEFNIQTLVVTNNTNILSKSRKNWKELANFKSEGEDERLFVSSVYTLPKKEEAVE